MPQSHDAKREHRKETYRLVKQRAKQRYIDEQISLQKEIVRLNDRLRAVIRSRSDGMLCWQQVSIAMREASVDSALENSALVRRITQTRKVVEDLTRWMAHMQKPLSIYLGGESWHNTYLTNSNSRDAGMHWILDHMNAHVNRAFDMYKSNESTDIYISVENDQWTTTYYGEVILPCNMQQASDVLWYHNPAIDPLRSEVVETPSPNLRYMRERAGAPTERCVVNLLYGRFTGSDRIVHSARAVLEDDKHPWEREYRADYMEWFVFEPHGLHETRARYVIRSFHPFRPDVGYFPLKIMAQNRGIDPNGDNLDERIISVSKEKHYHRQKALQGMLIDAVKMRQHVK